MRYFIDTNVLINIVERENLSDDVHAVMTDSDNVGYISSECVREYIQLLQAGSIKPKKGKEKVDIFDFIENELGLIVKYIAKEHLKTFANLEMMEKHKDPFDRLIIAHAITEKMPIISSDNLFKKYRKLGLELIFNNA